jgi:hypothetical protein
MHLHCPGAVLLLLLLLLDCGEDWHIVWVSCSRDLG